MGLFIIAIAALILIGYIVYFSYVISRKNYYEKVTFKLGKLYYELKIENKEFMFNVFQFVVHCDNNNVSIYDFKKGVVNTIEYFQKRNKLTDDVASKVLDIINKHWIERLRSLYFIDKIIIDSKMIV